MSIPCLDEYVDYAASVGVAPDVAQSAHGHIRSGASTMLAASGKFTSGKDTVALASMDVLGVKDVDHLSFASALKVELGEVFETLRCSPSPTCAIDAVVATQGVSRDHVAFVTGLVWTQVRADASLDGYSRTTEIRTALQYWGTEVRRSQDEMYWVKKAMASAITASAAGKSVVFTDLRYPNEEDACRAAGFYTIRLDISSETQAQRLWDRDGITPDPATMSHPSENALDTHTGFTLRFDNEGTLTEAVSTVTSLWM